MRDSIHSILRSAALLLFGGVIFLGCNEIPTPTAPDLSLAEVEGLIAPSASKHGKHQVSDMNDRFADETTGANGFARVVLTQEGGIAIDRVKALRLLPDTTYLLNVTVCPSPCPGGTDSTNFPAGIIALETSSVPTGKHGKFLIDDFDLGGFDDGSYRVDVFVTHTDSTTGVPGFPFLGGRDPLLACQPAFRVEVR